MTTPNLSPDIGGDTAVVLPFPGVDQPPQVDQVPAGADTDPTEPPEASEDNESEEGEEESVRLVDGPDLPDPKPWHQPPGVRHPLPVWMSSKAELKLAAAWAARHTAAVCRYHALHAVYDYAPKLAVRSPRGMWRILSATWRWAVDREGHPMRAEAVVRNDAETYLKLSRQRNERVAARGILLCFAAVATTAATIAAYAAASSLQVWTAGALLIGGCGMLGAPADKPLIRRAVVPTRVQKLTSDVVLRALGSLGIAGINQALAKGGAGISFPEEISRDGAGYRAVVDLPFGVTADDVIERRKKLASGLRRPLGCVWPEPQPDEHEGRLMIWVGDQDMAAAKMPSWPLLKGGVVDLFKPVPFGVDPRGNVIYVTLMFAAMVVGSIPRMGKTFSARLLMLAAALDPRCELHPYDLKGTGDFDALAPVSHRFRSGDEDEDVAYALADMRELRKELRRRAKTIRGLPSHLTPDSKVTPDLASAKRYGLHPILLAVDECQIWFEHPKYGEELAEIAEDLVRRGPAVGIITMFATQRPDAKSLPTGVSANAVLRFCLKVGDQTANDMVLGTSKYKQGIKATLFRRRDRGIGYLAGEGDDPQIVRTYFVNTPMAEAIVTRARVLREAAGTITGHAAGTAPLSVDVDPAAGLLEDLAEVFDRIPFIKDKVWGEELVALLAERKPAAYREWDAKTLTAALKPHGIRSVAIGRRMGRDQSTKQGYEREALTEAVTRSKRFASAD